MPTKKPAASPASRKPPGKAPATKAVSVSKAPMPEGPTSGLADFARERPGMVLGGAVLAGLVLGALIPRGAAGKLARGAAGAAALGSEVGLSLARQARENARHAAGEAGETLRDLEGRASDTARRLGRSTAAAAGNAGTSALDLVRTGLNLLATFKR